MTTQVITAVQLQLVQPDKYAIAHPQFDYYHNGLGVRFLDRESAPLSFQGNILKPNSVYIPGRSMRYLILCPVRLYFDQENSPYPCCSLAWKGKQPSWNRQGNRWKLDIASRRRATYLSQIILDDGYLGGCYIQWGHLLNKQEQQWWNGKYKTLSN